MKLNRWKHFPPAVRVHLDQRLRDRQITIAELDSLRFWIESEPDLPAGEWFKDFGSFKICGNGQNPTTFLTKDQQARGQEIDAEADKAEA